MSEILQSRFGYEPDNIRLLLDERATANNIRDRMEWLLDHADDESQRFFYFSGHGTRIPGYNALEQVDQQDEALVAHDFSWNDPQSALLDDEFMELYAQLPYRARFCAIFDCCHAGGISRAGGMTVRGLAVPDDIRHRLLSFREEKWQTRKSCENKREAVRTPGGSDADSLRRSYLGSSRALRPRQQDFPAAKAQREHLGPYMPLLFYACREEELAFEHRVGTQTHGAFTYALTEFLAREDRAELSLNELAPHVGELVRSLGYQQSPTVEGPREVLERSFLL